jgi:hypothetical protein
MAAGKHVAFLEALHNSRQVVPLVRIVSPALCLPQRLLDVMTRPWKAASALTGGLHICNQQLKMWVVDTWPT